MASEGTESAAVDVELSPELDEWLHSRAAALGVEPDEVLVQLLGAYRAAAELDGIGFEVDPESADELIGPAVREAIANTLRSGDGEAAAALQETVDSRARRIMAAEFEERDGTDERIAALEDRVEEVNSAYQEKLDDVRNRVIQVKRELDQAREGGEFDGGTELEQHVAATDERVEAIEERLAKIESREGHESDDGTLESIEDRLETLENQTTNEEHLEKLEERLRTVAWAVRDLREDDDGAVEDTVSELKRQAGTADVSRAKCGNCGEGVDISLLTEPACPRCRATLAALETDRGLFRSAKLQTAAQLESGEES